MLDLPNKAPGDEVHLHRGTARPLPPASPPIGTDAARSPGHWDRQLSETRRSRPPSGPRSAADTWRRWGRAPVPAALPAPVPRLTAPPPGSRRPGPPLGSRALRQEPLGPLRTVPGDVGIPWGTWRSASPPLPGPASSSWPAPRASAHPVTRTGTGAGRSPGHAGDPA